jgi:hypothetical protein
MGRRTLILASLAGVVGMLVVLASGFMFASGSVKHILCLLGLVGYLLCFGFGMSPVPWVANSGQFPCIHAYASKNFFFEKKTKNEKNESCSQACPYFVFHIFPEIHALETRSRSLSAAVGVNWLGNFVVAGSFLTVSDAIGRGETFLVFAGIAVLGWGYLFLKMPETFGKSLEQINELFSNSSQQKKMNPRV